MKETDARLQVIIVFRERLYVDRFGGIFSEILDYYTEPFVAGENELKVPYKMY